MIIVFITPRYYPHVGGVEYVVKSVAERLAKLGHEVTILAGEPNIQKPVEEDINRVRIIRWPTWSSREAYHIPMYKTKLEDVLKDLARKTDVIHIHSVHAIFTVSSGLFISKQSHHAKLVITPHYHGSGHTILRKLLWIFWRHNVSILLKYADVVHAVSKIEASLISTHYPYVTKKIVIVPNGVEENALSYKWQGQDSDYMLYAGRIEKYKRLEIAINIAKEIGLKLLIIGKGSYRNKLMKYANKVYKGGVLFLEPQPREKYLEFLSKARNAVNPSKYEAFSIFTAESLAMGTPIAVSKTIAMIYSDYCPKEPIENIKRYDLYLSHLEKICKKWKLYILHNCTVYTWNDIVHDYIRTLYT